MAAKKRAQPKKKKKQADSDVRTLTMIIAGLSGMLLLVGAMVGAYSYLNAPQPKKHVVVKAVLPKTPTPTAVRKALPQQNSGQVAAIAPPLVPPITTTIEDNLVASLPRADALIGKPSSFNPTTSFEPGEVVMADPPRGFEDKIRARGFRITGQVRLTNIGVNIVRVGLPLDMSVQNAIRVLSGEFPGTTIDANTQFDPSAGNGMGRAGANPRVIAGWQSLSPNCGEGLVLGQIDSGVDITHPALKGRAVTYRSFTKKGRRPGPPDHGTSIAAMLVGNAEWGGLLPGATLYAANMFELNEKGKKVGSAIGLLRSIDWLVSKKVSAVNLSIAGSDNKIVRKAFGLARRKNMILVAAVGNWGRADKPAYPAAYEHVVAVTATKGAELVYSHANSGDYVDFAAPGVGIYTALPGGGGKPQSGTSFATPYITVMAAILAHAGKTPDAATLRKLLGRATRDLGRPGKDDIFGYGSVMAKPACKS